MSRAARKSADRSRRHHSGLGLLPRRREPLSVGFIVIIAFKYLKGALAILVGFAALHFVKVSTIPPAAELARLFGVHAESHLVQRVAALISRTSPHRMHELAAAAFFIGAILVTESTLLLLEVWWATYLMIGLTSLGVPLEIYEIVHRPTQLQRYVALAANLAIVAYLWMRRNEFRRLPR